MSEVMNVGVMNVGQSTVATIRGSVVDLRLRHCSRSCFSSGSTCCTLARGRLLGGGGWGEKDPLPSLALASPQPMFSISIVSTIFRFEKCCTCGGRWRFEQCIAMALPSLVLIGHAGRKELSAKPELQ